MENNKKNDSLKKIIIIVFGLIIFLSSIKMIHYIFYDNYEMNKSIYGLWNIDETTKYEFRKKGKGELKLPLNTYKFKYKIKDNTINIDFEDNSVSDNCYTMKIENDRLILTETNGEKAFVLYK